MQRFGVLVRLGVAGVVVGGVCAACSAGFFDIGGIEFHLVGPDEFTQPQQEDAIPFTARGNPVDDGVVCDAGSVTVDRLESVDGETITIEDWAGVFDTAMQDDGVVEMYAFQTFECGDGSGSFSRH